MGKRGPGSGTTQRALEVGGPRHAGTGAGLRVAGAAGRGVGRGGRSTTRHQARKSWASGSCESGPCSILGGGVGSDWPPDRLPLFPGEEALRGWDWRQAVQVGTPGRGGRGESHGVGPQPAVCFRGTSRSQGVSPPARTACQALPVICPGA